MLSCLRRLTALSPKSATVLYCRNVAGGSATQPDKVQGAGSDVMKPYPVPEVYRGKMKGVQVDFLQRPKEGEALIDKIRALPDSGAYIFDYMHMKDELDEMDERTRKCFQLKYLSKDRQTYFLTKYLQDELKKTQDPQMTLSNDVELKVAKYILHYKNLEVHMARMPSDRKTKTINARINKGALLDAQKILMKVNFQRYDYLMNELRMDPPLDIWQRGPFHARGKPIDPEKSQRFIRKHRLKALKKFQQAQEAKNAEDDRQRRLRYSTANAERAADGIIQNS